MMKRFLCTKSLSKNIMIPENFKTIIPKKSRHVVDWCNNYNVGITPSHQYKIDITPSYPDCDPKRVHLNKIKDMLVQNTDRIMEEKEVDLLIDSLKTLKNETFFNVLKISKKEFFNILQGHGTLEQTYDLLNQLSHFNSICCKWIEHEIFIAKAFDELVVTVENPYFSQEVAMAMDELQNTTYFNNFDFQGFIVPFKPKTPLLSISQWEHFATFHNRWAAADVTTWLQHIDNDNSKEIKLFKNYNNYFINNAQELYDDVFYHVEDLVKKENLLQNFETAELKKRVTMGVYPPSSETSDSFEKLNTYIQLKNQQTVIVTDTMFNFLDTQDAYFKRLDLLAKDEEFITEKLSSQLEENPINNIPINCEKEILQLKNSLAKTDASLSQAVETGLTATKPEIPKTSNIYGVECEILQTSDLIIGINDLDLSFLTFFIG